MNAGFIYLLATNVRHENKQETCVLSALVLLKKTLQNAKCSWTPAQTEVRKVQYKSAYITI
jgi:hypothetical protein